MDKVHWTKVSFFCLYIRKMFRCDEYLVIYVEHAHTIARRLSYETSFVIVTFQRKYDYIDKVL
jgi:hypothetical protein